MGSLAELTRASCLGGARRIANVTITGRDLNADDRVAVFGAIQTPLQATPISATDLASA